MLSEWLFGLLALLIVVIFIRWSSHVPKRCENCSYYNGDHCDKCDKD